MKKNTLLLLSTLFALSVQTPSEAGISLSATRVIFEGGNKEAQVLARNEGNELMLQSWIDTIDGTPTNELPISVTPPLARIRDGNGQLLRLMYQGTGLPQDRESAFWLNVQEIPQQSTNAGSNTFQMAMLLKIKVFYRPKGLPSNALSAANNLQWQLNDSELKLVNSSHYHVTVVGLSSGTGRLSTPFMIEPASTKTFAVKGKLAGNALHYKVVNDFGGEDAYSVNLKAGELVKPTAERK